MESENKIIHNVLMVTSSEMDVEKILPVIGNSTDTRKYISFEKIIPIPFGLSPFIVIMESVSSIESDETFWYSSIDWLL